MLYTLMQLIEKRVVSMKTQLNGQKQLDKGELAKTIADDFGTGEITEKKGKNNKNSKRVNIQFASKCF